MADVLRLNYSAMGVAVRQVSNPAHGVSGGALRIATPISPASCEYPVSIRVELGGSQPCSHYILLA